MRCRRFLFIAAWAVILAGTTAASAQSIDEVAVTEADRAAVAGCLRESGDTPRACIGAVAVVCARQTGATGVRPRSTVRAAKRRFGASALRRPPACSRPALSLGRGAALQPCSAAGRATPPEVRLHGRPA